MPFYKLDDNGKISMSAGFNWDETDASIVFTEEEIERGYDGVLYKKSELPETPQEVLARNRMLPVLSAANRMVSEFLAKKGWDSFANAVSQTGMFSADAVKVQEQYDKLWSSVFAVQSSVEVGDMSAEDAIKTLPVLSWE